MAEALNVLYKAELIRNRGTRTGINDVESATVEGVDWHNEHRLHGELGHTAPAECETSYLALNPAPGLTQTR